jgi:tetratricopeptide (TPR) repeat protein
MKSNLKIILYIVIIQINLFGDTPIKKYLKETRDEESYNIIVNYLNKNEYQSAIDKIKKTKANDNNLSYLDNYHIGNLYLNLQDVDSTLNYYKKSYIQKPDFQDLLYNMAYVGYHYYDTKGSSVKILHKLLEHNPNDYTAYNLLGLIYSETNQKNKAILSFKKAIKINENYLRAYYNISKEFIALNDKKLSNKYIKKLKSLIDLRLKNNKNDYEALSFLANIYFLDKKYRLALKTNQIVIENTKPDSYIYYSVNVMNSEIYKALNDTNKYIKSLEKIKYNPYFSEGNKHYLEALKNKTD